jgi:hypothetical protein
MRPPISTDRARTEASALGTRPVHPLHETWRPSAYVYAKQELITSGSRIDVFPDRVDLQGKSSGMTRGK